MHKTRLCGSSVPTLRQAAALISELNVVVIMSCRTVHYFKTSIDLKKYCGHEHMGLSVNNREFTLMDTVVYKKDWYFFVREVGRG